MKKHYLITPLAAGLALVLCGSAAAGTAPDAILVQQTTTSQSNSQSKSQSEHQGNMATSNMSQEAKSAYREGEIWATYVVNPVLQSYKLDADVKGDTATLSGTVGTRYEKWLAEDLAQATNGIDTVTNNIKVDPSVVVVSLYVPANAYAQHVHDATTSARVNSLLLWNEYTDGSDINVKTRHGKVTLTGVADTKKAKQRATRIAFGAYGVASVDNQLTVGNPDAKHVDTDKSISDQSIDSRLQASYLYAFHVDAADLDVKVNDGKATLSGKVDSDFARQRAIGIAQHTRGVKSVDASGIDVDDGMQSMQTASNSSGY